MSKITDSLWRTQRRYLNVVSEFPIWKLEENKIKIGEDAYDITKGRHFRYTVNKLSYLLADPESQLQVLYDMLVIQRHMFEQQALRVFGWPECISGADLLEKCNMFRESWILDQITLSFNGVVIATQSKPVIYRSDLTSSVLISTSWDMPNLTEEDYGV